MSVRTFHSWRTEWTTKPQPSFGNSCHPAGLCANGEPDLAAVDVELTVLVENPRVDALVAGVTLLAGAVAQLPGFETNTPAVVRLRASAWKNDPPVEIRIPLGALAAELRRRLPLADVARDLPPGRKRLGWKRDFLASVREAAVELGGVSDRQITDAAHAYRRDRVKSVLTVVAEAASQPA